MLLTAVVSLVIAALASADLAANKFFDKVMLGMSGEIREGGLDALDVNDFLVKIRRTGFSNRDFKASFSRGTLVGLSTATRDGDCDRGRLRDEGDEAIRCDVVMPHARLAYGAIVNGDQITGRSHPIATVTFLTKVRVEIIIEGSRNNSARFCDLNVLSTRPLETSIVQGTLHLDPRRRRSFMVQVNDNLSREARKVLLHQYVKLLEAVVPRFVM